MSESREALRAELKDPEYRHAYAEDFLNSYVATQIVALREQRGLSQRAFGELIGTKQPGVSRLENINHASWDTNTLKKIARALDVRLKISFETFGTLLDEDESFSRKALERPDFKNDAVFHKAEVVPISVCSESSEIESLISQVMRDTDPLSFLTPDMASASAALLSMQAIPDFGNIFSSVDYEHFASRLPDLAAAWMPISEAQKAFSESLIGIGASLESALGVLPSKLLEDASNQLGEPTKFNSIHLVEKPQHTQERNPALTQASQVVEPKAEPTPRLPINPLPGFQSHRKLA